MHCIDMLFERISVKSYEDNQSTKTEPDRDHGDPQPLLYLGQFAAAAAYIECHQ